VINTPCTWIYRFSLKEDTIARILLRDDAVKAGSGQFAALYYRICILLGVGLLDFKVDWHLVSFAMLLPCGVLPLFNTKCLGRF